MALARRSSRPPAGPHPSTANFLPSPCSLLCLIQPMKHLLLSLIADRTGVVKDQPRISFILHPHVALVLQRPDDLLGVMGVHLTSKRLDIKSLRHKLSICPRRRQKNQPVSCCSSKLAYVYLGTVGRRMRRICPVFAASGVITDTCDDGTQRTAPTSSLSAQRLGTRAAGPQQMQRRSTTKEARIWLYPSTTLIRAPDDPLNLQPGRGKLQRVLTRRELLTGPSRETAPSYQA